MPNATLKDVAQAAGVSPLTVSLVLNKKGHISPDVCERAAAAARQLQYTKMPAARLSKRKYTGHLTVLVFEDPKKAFYLELFPAHYCAAGNDVNAAGLLSHDFARQLAR